MIILTSTNDMYLDPIPDCQSLNWKGSCINRTELKYPRHSISLFINENSIVLVKSGYLEIFYRDTVFKVGPGELVFLKKNVLVDFKNSSSEKKLGSVEYVLCSVDKNISREFFRMTKYWIPKLNFKSPVSTCQMDEHMLEYLNSLQVLFDEAENISGILIRLKLLELLFNLLIINKLS